MNCFSKRYLLNTNTNEVHDTLNARSECHLFLIDDSHKLFFDDLGNALSYPYNDGLKHNDGCAHCLPKYHTE